MISQPLVIICCTYKLIDNLETFKLIGPTLLFSQYDTQKINLKVEKICYSNNKFKSKI